VRTGKIRIFEASEARVEVVLASACLPFLFQAVEIDNAHYWDGGYLGNPALFPFFYRSDAQDIVIIHVNPLDRDEVPVSAPDIMNRINEISFNSSLLGELRAIGFVQKILEEGWIKDEFRDRLRNFRMHSIRSDESLEDLTVASKFDVDRAFLEGLKTRGRIVADAWLSENFHSIGARSSVDIRELYDSSQRRREAK
jgi:NTE family protein